MKSSHHALKELLEQHTKGQWTKLRESGKLVRLYHQGRGTVHWVARDKVPILTANGFGIGQKDQAAMAGQGSGAAASNGAKARQGVSASSISVDVDGLLKKGMLSKQSRFLKKWEAFEFQLFWDMETQQLTVSSPTSKDFKDFDLPSSTKITPQGTNKFNVR